MILKKLCKHFEEEIVQRCTCHSVVHKAVEVLPQGDLRCRCERSIFDLRFEPESFLLGISFFKRIEFHSAVTFCSFVNTESMKMRHVWDSKAYDS